MILSYQHSRHVQLRSTHVGAVAHLYAILGMLSVHLVVRCCGRQFEQAANAVLEVGAERVKTRVKSQSCMPFLRRKPALTECGVRPASRHPGG